ncbi:MAG: tryptophan halogenase [Rhodospirillaceae bacterium]|nr:tryptophan halogenase [Rhodospirillaceae bacterium]
MKLNDRITRFTIVGGGSAGWLAASLLTATLNRRNDGPDTEITVIESPNLPIIGVGEATTLSTFVTFAQLKIDEQDFLNHCDASFKGAVRFKGWNINPDGTDGDYYHPFDVPELIYGVLPAYHYHRRKAEGISQPSFAHSMSVLPTLMDANRAPKALDAQPFEGLANYSFHLDASLMGEYLKEYCTTLGVTYISDDVVDVTLDERGFVSALELKELGTHPVEFVIDCSGFRSLILQQALGEKFIPYKDHLLCDRALAVQIPHREGAPLEPYTTSSALGAGWSWNVPLYSRRGTGYVFSSQFRSDDDAIEEFLNFLGDDAKDAEPRVIPMSIGRARHSWVKNCLGVGLSAGFIEPLESTSIHLIQVAIRRFLDHLPDRNCDPALVDRYNHLVTDMYEDIRDFIAMHYAISNRDGEFWQTARSENAVPDRVRERLALWKHKLPTELDIGTTNPLFTEWSYLYVLFGKNYVDNVNYSLEAALSDEDYEAFAADMNQRRDQLLLQAPDHRQYLDSLRANGTEAWYRP